jgi:hypothetical protein
MIRPTLALSLLLLSLAACDHDQDAAPPPPSATADTGTPAPAGAPADASSPSGTEAPVGPISSRGQVVPGESSAAPQSTGDIAFDIPQGWQSQPPTSSMRLAQAVIPGPGGPGELAVFFFGAGTGGSVDANIQRWVDQMESADQPKPASFDSNGYKITWIDVRGTLKPSGMGMGPSTPQPNSRLLGAVVEGPGGPWFFKATGPDATLSAEHDAYLAMLKSIRKKG